jgi:hypothetical protein
LPSEIKTAKAPSPFGATLNINREEIKTTEIILAGLSVQKGKISMI